jgi:hypothetical protein
MHRADYIVQLLAFQERPDFLLSGSLIGNFYGSPYGQGITISLPLSLDLAAEGSIVEEAVTTVTGIEIGVLAEANLYEPLFGGTAAILGNRRDAIGRASGMKVIIEQKDSFCFS